MATVEQHPADILTNANGAAAPAGADIPVESPATGQIVGTVPDLGAEAVAELARKGRAAQPQWDAFGFEARAQVLRRAQKWLMDNQERVIETIISETGKTYEDAEFAEIGYAGNAFGFWAKQRRQVPRRRARALEPAAREGQEADPAPPPARPDRRDRPVELPADELIRRLHPGADGRQQRDPQAQRGRRPSPHC